MNRRRLCWTSAARLIAGATGLVLVALSLPNRPIRGAATAIAGIGLIEYAILGGGESGPAHSGIVRTAGRIFPRRA
jgi:hypothetical protein